MNPKVVNLGSIVFTVLVFKSKVVGIYIYIYSIRVHQNTVVVALH